MTKLPLLAGAFIISTILSPVGAIDVNIPGLSTHIYTPHKDDHILTFNSYDGTYGFTYIIFYPSFLSVEEIQKLRNMIEFYKSTNNPSFKLKEHVLFPDAEPCPLKHHSKSNKMYNQNSQYCKSQY